jgi:hypothetical protein
MGMTYRRSPIQKKENVLGHMMQPIKVDLQPSPMSEEIPAQIIMISGVG